MEFVSNKLCIRASLCISLDPELKEAIEGKERLINSLSPTLIADEGNPNKEEQEGVLTPFHSHVLVSFIHFAKENILKQLRKNISKFFHSNSQLFKT